MNVNFGHAIAPPQFGAKDEENKPKKKWKPDTTPINSDKFVFIKKKDGPPGLIEKKPNPVDKLIAQLQAAEDARKAELQRYVDELKSPPKTEPNPFDAMVADMEAEAQQRREELAAFFRGPESDVPDPLFSLFEPDAKYKKNETFEGFILKLNTYSDPDPIDLRLIDPKLNQINNIDLTKFEPKKTDELAALDQLQAQLKDFRAQQDAEFATTVATAIDAEGVSDAVKADVDALQRELDVLLDKRERLSGQVWMINRSEVSDRINNDKYDQFKSLLNPSESYKENYVSPKDELSFTVFQIKSIQAEIKAKLGLSN